MKVLIFDPFCGCAGDMILAALVSAGLDFEKLKTELEKLPLSGYEIDKHEVMRHGITCVKVDVKAPHEHKHRNLNDINAIIDSSSLNEKVKNNAKRIFHRLAEAEAKVHNTTIDKIHFHEVGAVDAIVDIVGACIGFELLDIEKIFTRPIGLGRGVTKSAHGTIPIPSPATSELVKEFNVVFHKVDYELSTPTGAAIITTMSEQLNDVSNYKIFFVGYGAGSTELETHPNFLRIYISGQESDFMLDQILQIETNIDNMNPEVFSYLFDGLFEQGAFEVFTTAINMKKNRPGTLLTVFCNPADKDKMSEFIFSNSTTSGMRYNLIERTKLKREFEEIETSFGPLIVKVFHINGKKRYYPEFDDLKKLASERKISIIELNQMIQKEISKAKEL